MHEREERAAIETALKDAQGCIHEAMVRLSDAGSAAQKLYGASAPLATQITFAVTHSALLDGYLRDALGLIPPHSASNQ
ncbi:MAG TPA: hypothetical protein VFN11_09860 [Ktedonobacterales bacterium]|nr:hypothetical protein [Ktedonobacterales bacterium]